MRENMLTAILFGHAGKDAMLREAADVWWTKTYEEIVEKANNCPECIRAGTNTNCLKNQKEFRTLPKSEKPNEVPFKTKNRDWKGWEVSVRTVLKEKTIYIKICNGK